MKIAVITLGYKPLRTSGLDISGERLVEGLLAFGHCVDVIAGERRRSHEIHHHPNLKIYRLRLDQTDWIGFAYRVAKLLNTLDNFDVVHFLDVHFAYAYHGGFVASLQHSFRQRLRSLDHSPTRNFSWVIRFAYYLLARWMAEIPSIRKAAGLLAGSATTREEFVRHYHIDRRRVAVVPHGVDVEFFKPSSTSLSIREQLSLKETEPVILFAGFITPRKGLEVLAKALPLVQPVPRLVIVGKWRNETYRQQVMKALEPVKQNVIEAGFVPDELMPNYYNLADVYISTSFLEGFGLPLAESLACETPVVALDVGSAAEVVGPGGILVREKSPEALAKAITFLLEDRNRRREMGQIGREYIVRKFNLEAMIKKTLDAYEIFLNNATRI